MKNAHSLSFALMTISTGLLLGSTPVHGVVLNVRDYRNFSTANVVIRNLDVRTYDNPGISGIDLEWAMQGKLENVFIHTGLYNV